ncbi:MAG: efflux RND transporter periplasmic adaptor subunit [Polyangiales bacterium]
MTTPALPRAALALSLGLWAGCHKAETAPEVRPAQAAAPVRVATAPAVARQIPDVLLATGSLVPDQLAQVTPIVGGRVMQTYVERGARVREGDPLVRLRDTDYRTSAAAAQASLATARARLGLEGGGPFRAENTPEVRAAQANAEAAADALRRAQTLVGHGSMSDAEYQRIVAQSAAADAQQRAALNGARAAYHQYQQARELASQAARNVADSIVRAPFSGEVSERMATVGEFVSPQRAVVTLVRVDPLRIEMQIPQERFAAVRVDQAVEIRVDAFPDRVFPATVRYISAAVRTDTRSLIAEAMIPNADGALRPGLFATARVNLGTQRSVVAVPVRAVRSEAGAHRVFVIADGRVSERVVTIADRDEREVLIERGVSAGERVAIERLDSLSDGAAVQQ